MRRDITIPVADYRVSAFLQELVFTEGEYTLKRILAQFSGNAGVVDIGVYVAVSGLALAGGITAAHRAGGEVYADAAVASTADPIPEINSIGQPNPFTVKAGESVYVYILTLDSAVSGTLRLFV